MTAREPNAGAREWNFDGLVGPTHNYAGLSPGNLASEGHRGQVANPRAAALQGLEKMKQLHELGAPQAVLPPHPRPALGWLRGLGFTGDPGTVLERASREAPALLAAAWSASSMWAANCATVSPSVDTDDGRVHFTPANLASETHRSLEAGYAGRLLRVVFAESDHFAHHPALPSPLPDEGAANHLRLAAQHHAPGLHVFVYGAPESRDAGRPRRYPARQSESASRAVARQHGLLPERVLFVQQHPDAIDAGVFHNDVIATADRELLWVHGGAWVGQADVLEALRDGADSLGFRPAVREIAPQELSLDEAVASYLFNGQLIRAGSGDRVFLGPEECRERETVRAWLEAQRGQGVDALHFAELRQSMHNGGGPACLRLRVVLRAAEEASIPSALRYDQTRHRALAACIDRHYRDRVSPSDLRDATWARECWEAHRSLLEVLGLGGRGELQADE